MHHSIDCRTAQGRTNRREELSKAEDFSDQLSEKQQFRMRLAKESGRWCGPSPFGYLHAMARSKDEPTIVPSETEGRWVHKSFDLFKSGSHGLADALRIVTGLGMRSKAGNKLNVSTFGKMLRNPVYIGKIRSKHGTFNGLHEAVGHG